MSSDCTMQEMMLLMKESAKVSIAMATALEMQAAKVKEVEERLCALEAWVRSKRKEVK